MGGAYTVAALLRIGALGLIVVLAVSLTASGLLLKPGVRGRFVLWVAAAYMALWTFWVLYNTVLLTRVLMKLTH